MHKTRTDLPAVWRDLGPERLLPIISNMPTSDLRALLDEFNKQGLHRDMSPSCYLFIVGEMIRRVDPREFRPYGNY